MKSDPLHPPVIIINVKKQYVTIVIVDEGNSTDTHRIGGLSTPDLRKNALRGGKAVTQVALILISLQNMRLNYQS